MVQPTNAQIPTVVTAPLTPTPGCFSSLSSIPRSILNFFSHSYADIRMFIRALNSMRNGTTSEMIVERIERIREYRIALLNCRGDQTRLQRYADAFHLDPIKDLFFYADSESVRGLSRMNDFSQIQQTRKEIIREFDTAISFQHTAVAVYTFFWGRMASSTSYFGIPGTYPYAYTPHRLLSTIYRRAHEITRLREVFAARNIQVQIPDRFKCSFSGKILSFPLFDPMHPEIQRALQQRNETAIGDRNVRHYMEAEDFENHMTQLTPPTDRVTGHCPRCQQQGSNQDVTRAPLLIDTALQYEILEFLREAVTPPLAPLLSVRDEFRPSPIA